MISKSNTRKEIEEKLDEYFEKGVHLVWIMRPNLRVVDVYGNRDRFTRQTAASQLDGGEVLRGFTVAVSELFPANQTALPGERTPKQPGKRKEQKKRRPTRKEERSQAGRFLSCATHANSGACTGHAQHAKAPTAW